MAIDGYKPGDGGYSANSYRLLIEERDRERARELAMREMREYTKPISNASHILTGMAEREIRKAVSHDPFANEVRNVAIWSGFALGLAGVVASGLVAGAIEGNREVEMDRAVEKFNNNEQQLVNDEYQKALREQEEERAKSYAEYKSEIASRTEALEAERTALYNEYADTKRSADAAIGEANRTYDNAVARLDQQEAAADRQAAADRAAADSAYQTRVDAIHSDPSITDKDAAIREAESTRQSAYDSIDAQHHSAITSITESRTEAMSARDSVISSERERVTDAQNAYREGVSEHRGAIAEAERRIAALDATGIDDAAARATAIAAVRESQGFVSSDIGTKILSDEQVSLLSKYEDDRKHMSPDERAEAERLITDLKIANGSETRADSYEFVKAVIDSNNDTAKTLATHLGTDEERALLSKIATADAIARDVRESDAEVKSLSAKLDAATKSGDQAAIESLTAQLGEAKDKNADLHKTASETPKPDATERAEAKALVDRYSGDLSSSKDLRDTITEQRTGSNALQKKINGINADIAVAGKQLDSIRADIAGKQHELTEIGEAKKALRSGKDADGKPLTDERRAALAALAGKDVGAISAELKSLKEKEQGCRKTISEGQAQVGELSKAKAKVDSNVRTLERNQGVITDTAFKKQASKVLSQTTFTGATKAWIKEGTDKLNSAIKSKGNKLAHSGKQDMATGGKMAKVLGAAKVAAGGSMAYAAKKSLEGKETSKKGNALSKKANKMMKQSLKSVQREVNRAVNKGNDIHKELFGVARKMARAAQKYELALSVGAMSLKVLKMPGAIVAKCGRHAFRHIGGHTKLGKQMAAKRAEKLKLKAQKKADRLAKHGGWIKFGHISALGVKGLGKTLLHAPTAILRAPRAIIGTLTDPTVLAKKAAQGAFRVGRFGAKLTLKTTRGALRFGGKMSMKLYRKTLGRTRLGRGMARLWDRVKNSRLVGFFKGIGNRFNRVKQWLKEMKKKIAAWFASAFSAVMSFLLTVAGYMILISVVAYVVYTIAVIIFSLFASILEAITQWLKELTVEEQTLVKTHPEFLMTLAVQYRDAELELFDIIRSASDNPAVLLVSSDPMYYAITRGVIGVDGDSGNFGPTSNTHANPLLEKISKQYTKTEYDNQNRVSAVYEFKSTPSINTTFYTYMSKYNSVSVKYYAADQLVKENGRRTSKLIPNAVGSDYEISNAKDAFAIVDALYYNKADRMQKMEALAYLGVGDAQLSSKSGTSRSDSLFWNTHKIIYQSGTSSKDVWYHATVAQGNNYVVDGTKQYSGDSIVNASDTVCDNQISQDYKYKVTKYQYSKAHKNYNNWNVAGYYDASHREYLLSTAARNGSASGKKHLTPALMYYQSGGQLSPSFTYSDGETYTAALNLIQTRQSSSNSLKKLHVRNECSRLHFYRENATDTYIVTDKDGYFVQKVSLKTTSDIYKLIAYVNVDPSDTRATTILNGNVVNLSTKKVILDYFYLDWNSSDQAYEFDVVSFEDTSFFETDKNTKEDLSYELEMGYNNSSIQNYKGRIGVSSLTLPNGCTHEVEEKTEETKTISFAACKGHIDLKVAIGVLAGCETDGGKDNEDIFTEAMYVEGLEEDEEVGSFLWIFSYDKKNDAWGFGTTVRKAYHPKEDWKPGNDNRVLARLKSENDVNYTIGNRDIKTKDEYKTTSHVTNLKYSESPYSYYGYSYPAGFYREIKTFSTLIKLDDGSIGFGFSVGGKVFYVPAYKSGPQKAIECYEYDASTGKKTPRILDITINNAGKPTVKIKNPS